jgi:excisionase family DNA binding protein
MATTTSSLSVLPVERLMTLDQLCELTQIPKSTLYHLISEGRGPASLKIGRNLRFHPSKVNEWFDDLAQARA